LPSMINYWEQKKELKPIPEQNVVLPEEEKPTQAEEPAKVENINESKQSSDITLANYNHPWLEELATVSLKNNTDKTIYCVMGRMMYYDIKGNMLDYRDITQTITIEPGMTKSFTIPGYGEHGEYYYYKSTGASIAKPYKVEFKWKSYKHD